MLRHESLPMRHNSPAYKHILVDVNILFSFTFFVVNIIVSSYIPNAVQKQSPVVSTTFGMFFDKYIHQECATSYISTKLSLITI